MALLQTLQILCQLIFVPSLNGMNNSSRESTVYRTVGALGQSAITNIMYSCLIYQYINVLDKKLLVFFAKLMW